MIKREVFIFTGKRKIKVNDIFSEFFPMFPLFLPLFDVHSEMISKLVLFHLCENYHHYLNILFSKNIISKNIISKEKIIYNFQQFYFIKLLFQKHFKREIN